MTNVAAVLFKHVLIVFYYYCMHLIDTIRLHGDALFFHLID